MKRLNTDVTSLPALYWLACTVPLMSNLFLQEGQFWNLKTPHEPQAT